MQQLGGGRKPGPTLDEFQARVGKRLDDVAKILAGALVTVAGVMTALGLTSDVVFVALNNESWPIYVASICAILAIVCSIVALLIHPTRRGNVWETVVLTLGVIFYMVALSVAVVGASQAAGGNGRPSLTHVKLEGPASGGRLSFGVHADGVDRWASVNVYVTPLNLHQENLTNSNDIYNVSLRPNAQGEIQHRTSVPFSAPRGTWGIEIIVVTAGGNEECEVRSPHGPTCSVIQLPL